MGNTKFSLDFDFLRVGFWLSVFLVLIKYTCDVNISLLMALLPLFISLLILFGIIFTIGVITIALIIKEMKDQEDDEDDDWQTKLKKLQESGDNQEDSIKDEDEF